MIRVPRVGFATFPNCKGPALPLPIVRLAVCRSGRTEIFNYFPPVATPWSMTRMRSVQVNAVTYVTAWGSSVTWGSPHQERDRDRASKMTLPMLAHFDCPSEHCTSLIFTITGCGTCRMNWECMCKWKISVALAVVLEGKFESERPNAIPNYFSSRKQNVAITKVINVNFRLMIPCIMIQC